MDVLDDVGFVPNRPAQPVETAWCDRCGARAYVLTIINGTELNWCGHHGTQYFEKLTREASVIIDLRDTILT